MEDMIPCALKDQEVFQRVWQRVMAGRDPDGSPISPAPSGGGDVSCDCLRDLLHQDGEGLPSSCLPGADAPPPEEQPPEEQPPAEEAPAPQPPSQGLPPRKYYAVTERGMDYLAAMSGEWESLLEAINEIKEGTQHG